MSILCVITSHNTKLLSVTTLLTIQEEYAEEEEDEEVEDEEEGEEGFRKYLPITATL